MCVYLNIHNKYTQNTYMYYVNKNVLVLSHSSELISSNSDFISLLQEK